MCQIIHPLSVKTYNGKFFDVIDNQNLLFITDYQHLTRKIMLNTNNTIELGESTMRAVVTSITMLKCKFEGLISASIQIIMNVCDISEILNDSEKELLINQLVFDVLFDKYIAESKLMTRNGYSTYMAEKLCVDKDRKIAYSRAINEQLTRGMRIDHDRNIYSNLRDQWKLLGIDPDKYSKYYTPHMKENSHNKKPQVVWDQLYYNFCIPLTSRQYRRQLTKEGRNYSYEEITNDLISYNAFVNKLLPRDNESVENYFRMSLDYYHLESYKRIDFMFKLISAIPQMRIAKIDKKHFLVKRFHPIVLVPYEKNGALHYTKYPNYYRPLFMIESKLHSEISKDANPDYEAYAAKLLNYQIIHAKTYELFKYHYEFKSTDYSEIKQFLLKCYNMRSYHQSNPIWEMVQRKERKDMDDTAKQQLKEQIRHFFSINEAFFWKSSDRDYTIPETNK